MPETCPDRTELSDLVLGKLDEPQLTAVASHIESCGDCQTTIGLIAENEDTFVEAIRERALADEMADESQFQVAMARIEAIGREATPNDQLRAEESPSQLREYELLAKLGEGGMGTVYKALHTRLRRVVALKVLNTHRRHDPAVVERFGREIEAVGKLSHPNIVTAHDAGEEDGMHYLVMELVEGVDLHTLVAQHGPLLVADACEIIRQAALGLQHAHEHRLVHRDLKPSNLMLAPMASAGREPQGASRGSWAGKRDASSPAASAVPLTVSDIERQATNDSRLAPSSPNQPAHAGRSPVAQVKILDLGLARLQGEQMQGREEITATGQVMGTLDYMAPEQADDSHRVDTRSDIYALGCTLYKLLTGHAPFSGESYNSIAKKLRGHAENPPPPIREARPAVPEALADLIDRMLAKSPDDRPGTPADLAAALGPFCDGCDLPALVSQFDIPSQHNLNAASQAEIAMMLPTPKPSLPGRGRRVGIFVAVASLLFFAVAAAAIVIAIRRGDGPATTVEVPEGSQVKIGDDGRVEVKVSADQKSRDQSPPIPEPYIGDPHGDPLPSEKAVARLGSIRLRHGGKIRQVAFSSDGKWLASLGEDDAVRIWDPNTGKQHRRLFHRERGWMTDRNSRLRSARSFCFTPDGASIVSLHLEDYGSKNPSILCIWDVDTGERRKSFPCGDRNFHSTVAVSPDGRIAAVGGRDGAVHLWNLGTGELHARFDYPRELKEIAESLQEQVATGIVAFSPDGELIAAVYSEHILLWELATGKVRRSLSAWRVGRIAFSPDGKTLVAVDDQNVRFPRWDVATGRKLETLLGHTHWVSGVAFSPKGDWMVTAGSYTLRFWNADGEQVRVLGEEDSYQGYGPVAVSPDGNTIAVSTGFRILLLDHETLRERLADPWQASTMYRIAFVDTSGGGASTPKPTAPLVVASYLTRRWELEPAAPTHRGSANGLMRVRPPPKSPPLPEGGDPMNWWETRLGRRLEHLADLGPDRELLTVLPQVRQFVTEDKDPVTGQRKSLTWWDLETGTQIHTLTFEGRGVHWPRIAVSPDGERVASSHAPAFVHWPSEKKPEPTVIVVREVRTGNQLRVFSAPKTELLGFSPNSKQLQILSASGELLLWDLAAPQSVAPQAVPAAVGWPTESWAMTPQCHLLAWSDGCDPQTGHGRIRLYDLQKRRELEPLDGHLGPVRSVAFSPDGRWLASGGSGGTGLVWDMAAAIEEEATATETSRDHHSEDDSTGVASTPTEGKVVGVGPADEKVVWLNLGKDDGLRAKDVWWVYDKDADPAQAQRKGVVEITKVSDSHLTEARVLEHKTDNPILPGDRVVLKTRSPAAGDDAADETEPSTDGKFEALAEQVDKLIDHASKTGRRNPEQAIAALQTQAAVVRRAEDIEPAGRLTLVGKLESAIKSLQGREERKQRWRSDVEKAIAEARELAKTDREAAARRLGSVVASTEIVEYYLGHFTDDDPFVQMVFEHDRLYKQLDPTGRVRRQVRAERFTGPIRDQLNDTMAEIRSCGANADADELARTFAMARGCFDYCRSRTGKLEDEGVQSEMSREIENAERQLAEAVRWSFRNPVVLDSYDAADRFASGPLAWDSCGPGFVLASQRRMGSGPLDLWLSGAPVGGGELLGFRRLGSVPDAGELLMSHWDPRIRIAQPAGIDGDTLTLRGWDYDIENTSARPQSFDVKWQLRPPLRPDRAGSVMAHVHDAFYQRKGGEPNVIQSLFLRLIDKENPHRSQLLFVRSSDDGKTWPDPPRLVADDLRWPGPPLMPVCFHPSYADKDPIAADHLICMGMDEDHNAVFFRTLDGGEHWTKEFVRLPDPETGKSLPAIPLATPHPSLTLAYAIKPRLTLVYAIPTGDGADRTYRLCHAFAGDGARSWADATTIASNLSLPDRQLFSIRASSGSGVTAVTCPVPGDRPGEYGVDLLLSIDERHQFWRAIQLDEQLGGRVGLTLPRAPSYGARVFLAAEVENPDRTENRHQLIVQEIAPVALEFARSKEDESRD